MTREAMILHAAKRREKIVALMREGKTLRETAEIFGVTKNRIAQILKRARLSASELADARVYAFARKHLAELQAAMKQASGSLDVESGEPPPKINLERRSQAASGIRGRTPKVRLQG